MVVPRLPGAVPQLDETDALFQQAPRDQNLSRVNALAIHGPDVRRFLADVEGIVGLHLHPIGKLERLNARLESRVLPTALFMFLVELVQEVELPALLLKRSVVVADVFDELLELRVLRVDERSLIHAGQESGTPVLGFLDGITARTHREESRQVQVLRAEPERHPGTD